MATRTKTTAQLVKDADKYFSLAVRYRDGLKRGDEWYTICITCDKWIPLKQAHAGHFMSRRFKSTRWDDENVNGQCSGCNTFRAGEQYKYSIALDLKYGRGTAEKLSMAAHLTKKTTREELLQIIGDSKEQINYYEKEL